MRLDRNKATIITTYNVECLYGYASINIFAFSMLPQLAFEAAITDFVGPLCDDDAHQHAALLLVKSQIYGLRARTTIRIGDAIDIVETADRGQDDVAVALDEPK